MSHRVLALLGLGLAATTGVAGQARTKSTRAIPESVTVVADSTFGRSGLRRRVLGNTYRDLWATPVRVEVLDLGRFAGGLKPVESGGGQQTKSIRLEAADGRQYQFRLMRKDLQLVGPRPEGDQLARLVGIGRKDLRNTFVGSVVRDQVSAVHPGGMLVVPPLLEVAEVLHAPPVLRYMPDDPRLGEFRAEFGNQLGTIEERPTADGEGHDFAGAEAVEGTEKLIEALEKRPWIRVDSREFLAARLIDLFVGDWDRHEDQWRWALLGTGDSARWHPIPRDRDYVFSRYDGLLMGLVRYVAPKLLSFDEHYAPPHAATFNGRHLDRRLLNDLEWRVWDSVARAIQTRLTNAVIDRAVDRLPPEYEVQNGATLRRVLRVRRDKLHQAAQRYYRFLAEQVIIHAGDEPDHAEVSHHPAGRTEVRLSRANPATPYYVRTFTSGETDEIRIFLHDGADRAALRGEGAGPRVRVIGGGGPDTLIDESRARNSRFYDAGEETVAVGRDVDRKPYVQPSDTNASLPPQLDWGEFVGFSPRLSITSHSGVTPGMKVIRRGYGFRRQPYASLHTTSLDYSFERTSMRIRASTRWRRVNRDTYYGFSLLVSGIEGQRFYGFGNGTGGESPVPDRFLVVQHAYELSPYLGFGLERRAKLWLMLRSRHTVTNLDDPVNRLALIDSIRPLGVGDFGHLGPAAEFQYDSRNTRFAATGGLFVTAEGGYYLVTWSGADGAFGTVEGSVATYLSPGSQKRLTLALRSGARRAWGDFPYFEAANLGGKRNLRAYHRDRFAGESALFGNAELRLKLTDLEIFLPGELGVFGLADAGRVFFEDDPSRSWHVDFGGGLWFGVLSRSNGVTFGAARGDEGWRTYVMLGMPY